MNTFLQRMLRKNSNEELNVQSEKDRAEEEKNRQTGRSDSSKGNWIRKLGNYSATVRQQVPSAPARTNAMRPLEVNNLRNTHEQPTPARTSGSPQTPPEMPDLESIVREFETGFHSPSKSQETSIGQLKQKNFVKKIVAAFEVKYNNYNDPKMAQESKENQEGSPTKTETPKRRGRIFGSPLKDNLEEDAEDTNSSSKSSRRSGVFGSPFKLSTEEIKACGFNKPPQDVSRVFEGRNKNLKSYKKSGILSSPPGGASSDSSSSEIYTYPVDVGCRDSKDSGSDSCGVFKFDKDKIRGSNFLKVTSLDDTKTLDSTDLDLTLPEPEETILLERGALPKTSTMINEPRDPEDDDECFEISKMDRTPKIVGAFLKEPIEVEDTSIDWIPITGKKLPRKRSLKKLLNALTGKKSLEKRSKMFSSERNLCEEPRELQDSGYDEKSCSSSSLNSLISVTEVLLQQENSSAEPEMRRNTLTTFGPRNSEDDEEDEVFCDTYSCSSKRNRKKLLLTEVPREAVKLDLGPTYPSSSKILTMSLDRKSVSKKLHPPSPVRALTKLPKHPHLSKIPKHPFVSLTKMDEPREAANVEESREEPAVIVKNDLYEVEFRRSTSDVRSTASCRSSSSAESDYDVPRRFLSKSENELRSNSERDRNEPIYDVPRPTVHERPKSSHYEDVVSLRRRSTRLAGSDVTGLYAVPRELQVRHDAIEPRESNVYGTNNSVPSSLSDLIVDEMRSAF